MGDHGGEMQKTETRRRGWSAQQFAVKVAVHWVRPGCALAQSSPNLTWADMWSRAVSARPQRVSDSARTDSRPC